MNNHSFQHSIMGVMMARRPWTLIMISICLFTLMSGGCGYHLVGQGISLPRQYWNMSIPVFSNKTARQDIAQIITLAVIDTFSRTGELNIVAENEATAQLIGEITSYREQPQNINSSNLAQSYRIIITSSVKLVDGKTKEIYWEDKKLFFSQDYDVSEYLSQIEFAQGEARRLAAEDFADRLRSVVLEGF